jgi:hypothetical protein
VKLVLVEIVVMAVLVMMMVVVIIAMTLKKDHDEVRASGSSVYDGHDVGFVQCVPFKLTTF